MFFIVVDPEAFSQSCYGHILRDSFPGSGYEPLSSSRDAMSFRNLADLSLVVFNLDVMDCELSHFIRWFREANHKIWLIGTTGKIDHFLLHRLKSERPDTVFFRHAENVESLEYYAKRMLCNGVAEDPLIPSLLLGEPKDSAEWEKTLTGRERELVGEFAAAKSDLQVATKYNLSHITVKHHRASILQKLSLKSTPELVRYGIERGFCKMGRDGQLFSTTANDGYYEGRKQGYCVKVKHSPSQHAALMRMIKQARQHCQQIA